jgi:acyl-CoA dehydrogenase
VEALEFFGMFLSSPGLYALVTLLTVVVVGFFGSPMWLWTLAVATLLIGWGVPQAVVIAVVAVMAIFVVVPVRRALISSQVMKLMKSFLPKISETERVALEAGVVWVEKDLFSGKPDFRKLLAEPYPKLTPEEKAFMDNQVEKLCSMLDSWKIWKTREMEQHIWDYMKKEKFFGMIIPKEYGGLEFSALANSHVVMKLASRCLPACITVMVPNSLGPAELLIHYGTEEQKKNLLPKLADGREIPCFGLTEPLAGSDAGSITSSGVLFKKDGKLWIRLNWNKRWITLAAVSTTIGLAFRLRDPENLFGKGEDIGITCALIPSTTKGVVIGKRHDPLGVPFYNCPTQGVDVEIPADFVVGGESGFGIGWSMLMDCLSAGRGISLPAQATGGAKLIALVTSAHGVVRQQFGVSIGRFEGVEEPLSRIAGYTYALEAARSYTLGALDQGIKPPVITAMLKYYATELGRKTINDGMDIMGGAGISMGPRNLLGQMYIATPIGITVEGANILTRTLIVFGQGALRAHPFAFQEVKAVDNNDLKGFDAAFFGHIGHVVRNTFRSIVLSVTRGYAASSAGTGELSLYTRRLTWASASFAILADVAMGALGGSLKFREKITGRFADILAWMYIGTATIRRWDAEGRRPEDLAFAKWTLKHALVEIQSGFGGIFDNMFALTPEEKRRTGLVKRVGFGFAHWFFKEILGAWSRINSIGSQATDNLQHAICNSVLTRGEMRNRLVEGIYIPKDRNEQIGRLEYAMEVALKSEAAEGKIRKAIKAKVLPKKKIADLLDDAKSKNIITAEEHAIVKESSQVRYDAIQVDDFSEQEFLQNKA